MLKTLIIGAGTMGKAHCEAYKNIEQSQVVGIVEKDRDQARRLGFKESEIFSSIKNALDLLKVDLIDICVPTPYHTEVIKNASLYVKNIICEKPLTKNSKDAKHILNYCNEKGINLYVGHVVRFFKEYNKAKEIIQSGAIGNLGVVHMSRVGPFPNASYDWYSNYKYSGGLVTDLIIHDFDFLRWCFGDINRVFAKGLRGNGYINKDYALVTLRFKNGVIAHVEGSWAHEKFCTSFEFAGANGIIEYNSEINHSLQISNTKEDSRQMGVSVPMTALKDSPYQVELSHFVNCILNNETPIVSAEDAVKAVEVAEAVNYSIDTGEVVYL